MHLPHQPQPQRPLRLQPQVPWRCGHLRPRAPAARENDVRRLIAEAAELNEAPAQEEKKDDVSTGNEKIDIVTPRQVVQDRSCTQLSSAMQRVWRFRAQDERGFTHETA